MDKQAPKESASVSDPCKLRILVLPVGQITRKNFYSYFNYISEYSVINVENLLNSNISEKSKLEKRLFKLGQIQIKFVTEVNSSHAPLEEFQHFRRIVGVIGIADFKQCDDLAEGYNNFVNIRKKLSNVIAHRCFTFQSEDRTNAVEEMTMVPEAVDSEFYIQISMFELVGKILSNFCDQLDQATTDATNTAQHSRTTSLNVPSQLNQNSHRKTLSFQKDFSSRVLDLASSVGLGTDQKAKRQVYGRQIKLVADLNLMIGHYPEAAKMFLKAIDINRTNGDHLFYIFSLEGYYCTILLLFSINADPAEYSYKGEPEDLLMTIVESYLKELIKLYEETPHPLLYIEAYLKLAKLLTIIWKLGTTKSAIEACIRGDFVNIDPLPLESFPGNKRRVTRADISAWVMYAWNPTTEFLSLEDKIDVFSTMGAIFGSLGYKRKQSFFLRQASLMLFPALAKKTLKSEKYTLFDLDVLKASLENVCSGYKIQFNSKLLAGDRMSAYNTSYSDHFGWVELQKTIFKESIAILEAFSDYSSMAEYIADMLFHLYPYLTKTEQEESYQSLNYLAECHPLNRLDLNFTKAFPNMMIFNRLKFDDSRALFPLKSSNSVSLPPTNPLMLSFKKEGLPKLAPMLVVNEAILFEFTISNPFRIPLEFEDMVLIGKGIEFSSESVDCLVPPKTSVSLSISVTPLTKGKMKLRGVKFCLLGDLVQEFEFNTSTIPITPTKASYGDIIDDPVFDIEVIEPQPYLKIVEASLGQPSIMIYEGERYIFSITLKNESLEEVNFVDVVFEEKRNLNTLKNLVPSREDIYERTVEKDLPLFTWTNKIDSIKPGEKKTLSLEAYGKPFCTHGTIVINYGKVSPSESQNVLKVYCRKKFYHINISVTPVVSPLEFDVIAGTEAGQVLFKKQYPDFSKVSYPQELCDQIDRHLLCLLVFTFKNLTNLPVCLKFKLDIGDVNSETNQKIEETITGFDCKRILVPYKRMGIKGDQATQPIPKAGHITDTMMKREMSTFESTQSSAFWFKECLLKRLSAEWCFPDSGRSGSLPLRWIRLDERTKSLVQLEEVWLRAALEGEEESVTQISTFHYQCTTGKSVTLNIDLFNRRDKPLRPCIRIQPYLDYHNGHFEAANVSSNQSNQSGSNLRIEQASPLMVLGRSQEIFDEIPPHTSAIYSFQLFPTSTGKFRIGCSCQDLGELIGSKDFDPIHFDSTSLFLDVAPLVLDIINM